MQHPLQDNMGSQYQRQGSSTPNKDGYKPNKHLLTLTRRELFMCVFLAIKSELTYNNPNRACKVSKILKEWYNQFYFSRQFPWPSGVLNPVLQNPSALFYQLHYTEYQRKKL